MDRETLIQERQKALDCLDSIPDKWVKHLRQDHRNSVPGSTCHQCISFHYRILYSRSLLRDLERSGLGLDLEERVEFLNNQ